MLFDDLFTPDRAQWRPLAAELPHANTIARADQADVATAVWPHHDHPDQCYSAARRPSFRCPTDRQGSRATTVASDHHVARPTLQSVSEPSAESVRARTDLIA